MPLLAQFTTEYETLLKDLQNLNVSELTSKVEDALSKLQSLASEVSALTSAVAALKPQQPAA